MQKPETNAVKLFSPHRQTRHSLGFPQSLLCVFELCFLMNFELIEIKIECEFADHSRDVCDPEITSKSPVTPLDIGFLFGEKFFFRDDLLVGHELRDRKIIRRNHRMSVKILYRFFQNRETLIV